MDDVAVSVFRLNFLDFFLKLTVSNPVRQLLAATVACCQKEAGMRFSL